MAYVLKSWDKNGMQWLKLQFSGPGDGMAAGPDEGKRFDTPVEFRRAVMGVLRPGSVVVVTPQSLTAGSPGKSITVIKED
jgi:hypothetical protein